MRKRTDLFILLVLLPSRGIAQRLPSTPSRDSIERVLSSIRATYDTGFARLMAALPASARDTSSELWPVWQIGQFRTQAVAWVQMSGDRYLALSRGSRMPAWLVVVPPGSDALRRMKGTLQLDPTATILVAQIAPEQVTVTWAGVFLTHQLSLLASYVQGDTLPSDRVDLQAADIEFIAADFIAGGSLRRSIDSVLARWAPQSGAEAVDRIRGAGPSLFLALAASVSREPSRSKAEAELRGGAAVMATVIRYCELHDLPRDECASLLRRLARGP